MRPRITPLMAELYLMHRADHLAELHRRYQTPIPPTTKEKQAQNRKDRKKARSKRR